MYRKYCVGILVLNCYIFIFILANKIMVYANEEAANYFDINGQNNCDIESNQSYYLAIDNCILENTIFNEKVTIINGKENILTCITLHKRYEYIITEEERDMLEHIVEAEATGEDIEGKLLVANVILNRVNSERFPDDIESVIFQHVGANYQFSPVKDGRYYSVTISENTKSAVEQALQGIDHSEGALYFMARKYTSNAKANWFDTRLTRLFEYGGHEFYK